MEKKDFILNKLKLMKKDNQKELNDLVEPLAEMAEKNETHKIFKVPADGKFFKVDFDAVQVKEGRLVITAQKERNGMFGNRYVVNFKDTTAAYLYGFYHDRHRHGGWPFIEYDVRSYRNHPNDSNMRVYVDLFRADEEVKKLIIAMENTFPSVCNTYNKYINDNLLKLQLGIANKKTPNQAAYDLHKHLMPSIGYKYCEAIEMGQPKGKWAEAAVHWFKKKEHALL